MPPNKVKSKKLKLRRQTMELTVVGLQYRLSLSTRRMISQKLGEGRIEVKLVREPDNEMDRNAIKVVIAKSAYKGLHIGYLRKQTALVLADAFDEGEIIDPETYMTALDPAEGTAELVFHYRKSPGTARKKKT